MESRLVERCSSHERSDAALAALKAKGMTVKCIPRADAERIRNPSAAAAAVRSRLRNSGFARQTCPISKDSVPALSANASFARSIDGVTFLSMRLM